MMIKFALYGHQSRIASKLKGQYPANTKFVILPMDMEFMGAGKLKDTKAYIEQHNDLARIKKRDKNMMPFMFIDPRRIRAEGKSFLDYELDIELGKVILKDCLIKKYIEQEGFQGFKIYPALGYFPFDNDLLVLWKYAADNGIPIMSHGVIGVIYDRNKPPLKNREHLVFKETIGNNNYVPLGLHQSKPKDFQVNYTHPMNFLCLIDEALFRIVIQKSNDKELKTFFGYTASNKALKYNLNQLKVCYAHFGGAEEWNRYFEQDRNPYSQQLNTKPNGISFVSDGNLVWGRLELLWKGTDWYSIICSMMMQYPNFYSDISYMVSHAKLYPLLRDTLRKGFDADNDEGRNKLRKRVLFGTDFYVVRSQMADNKIVAELRGFLSEEEFDLIARENTALYLQNKNG